MIEATGKDIKVKASRHRFSKQRQGSRYMARRHDSKAQIHVSTINTILKDPGESSIPTLVPINSELLSLFFDVHAYFIQFLLKQS